MMRTVTISNDQLKATFNDFGAELCSLQNTVGHEYLWQAGPAWPRHAPILFPIIGRLRNDILLHDGVEYRMGQHGFARDRQFTLENARSDYCIFALDNESDARFPFRCRLHIAFSLISSSLKTDISVTNTGETMMAASVGAHPAFKWPIVDGVSKAAHSLRFEHDEPSPIRRLANGLLDPHGHPTPVKGSDLELNEDLFAADAIVFDNISSRSVAYAAPSTPTIRVAWEGFEQLGLWSKPGADFICIEPWFGYASPADFTGDFFEKPGVFKLAPSAVRRFSYTISIEG